MPAVTLSPIGNGFQFFTASGLPLSGGLLNTYIAGTTTPLATYTDSAGTITNANPIVLGPDGRPPGEIWLLTSSGYKFVLTDSLASPVGPSLDNITGIANLNNATLTGNTVIGTTGNTLNVANGALVVSAGNTALGGNLTVAGNTTLGDAGADIVTVTAGTVALGTATLSGTPTFSGLVNDSFGVTLGNTTRAGTSTLDWYEKPTAFTPTLRGATTAGATTYAIQLGQYSRIGNMVFISVQLSWSAATGTGTMVVAGMPYAIGSGNNGGVAAQFGSTGFGTAPFGLQPSSAFNWWQIADNAGVNVTVKATGTLAFQAMYFV